VQRFITKTRRNTKITKSIFSKESFVFFVRLRGFVISRAGSTMKKLSLAAVLSCAVALHAQPPSAKPRVWVLSTGGTISGRGDTRTNLTDYRSGSVLGEQLVAAVPEIASIADVKVEQIVNVSSTDISLDNWLTMARRINAMFAADAGVDSRRQPEPAEGARPADARADPHARREGDRADVPGILVTGH